MPYGLETTSRAERDLSTLPEKVAVAAIEFITGTLLDNPQRVGGRLKGDYEGARNARLLRDYRILYNIEEDDGLVVVFRIAHRRDVYRT